ncbi:MAG: phage holin family protein [Candidatus Firestonebacteria bacterium]|nr:phage holin family protein [Candidatus Firestonebacteria bacterium]
MLMRWLIMAVAVLLSAYALPGVSVAGFGTAILVALVLGLANAVLKPLLILITLPITLLTLGLFILVINTSLVMLASALVSGFTVRNFWWAFLFSVVLSAIGYVLETLILK